MARKKQKQLTRPQMDALFGPATKAVDLFGALRASVRAKVESRMAEIVTSPSNYGDASKAMGTRIDCPGCGHFQSHEPRTSNLSSGKCPDCWCLSGWQKPKTEE